MAAPDQSTRRAGRPPVAMIGSPAARRFRAAAARVVAGLVVPAVHGWLLRQEAVIRRQGRPLSEDERAFGHWIGLRHPGRVRILTMDRIPLPASGLLKWIGRFSRAILAEPVALTAGRGIYCRRGIAGEKDVLRHELVHVRQFERLGRRSFLKRYIRECLVEGYADAPLEIEARHLSRRRQPSEERPR